MRKLLALAAAVSVLAMLGLSMITASADSPCSTNPGGTTTCTMNTHDATMPIGPVPPCVLAGSGTATGVNSIFHITVNGAGDLWFTGTITAAFTFTTGTPPVTYTGHFTIWFGTEINNQNGVQNSTFNAQGRAPDGSTIDLHMSIGFGVSASGQPIMHMNVTC